MRKESSLETVLRIRSKHGAVLAEYTIREGTVSIVNYFPAGMIQSYGQMSLEDFLTNIEKIREERQNA